LSETLAQRLARVRERIDAATKRRGPGAEVTLIGVSKRQPVAAIEDAQQAGLVDLGENYAQELRDKHTQLGGLDLRWHFIGAVQRNKVKHLVGRCLVHTVDRLPLLEAIQARAEREGVDQEVLVEVNLGEEQKAGLAPSAVPTLLDAFADAPRVRCVGLMVIPPVGSPEQTRPHFQRLRQLRKSLLADTRANVDLQHLSMGMSADFEVAIEEGATMVRVGTAIFGPRPT
jgi:hypothetical protein